MWNNKILLALVLIITIYPSTHHLLLSEQTQPQKTAPEIYQEKAIQIQKICAEEYLKLAKWCKSNKLYPEAGEHLKKVLEYEPENTEAKAEFEKGFPKDEPQETEKVTGEYDKKINALANKLADKYTKLGIWCRQNKLSVEAEKEFNHAIELSEDHPEARKQLGQEKAKGFGWVNKDIAAKLKQGLREYQGKWLPKNEVEKIRSDWANAWEIKTKHYLVKTNDTYEKGYELAQYAEDLYKMYFNIFGRHFNLKEPNESLIVWYFKSQEDYYKEGGGSASCPTGFYATDSKIARFWNIEQLKKRSINLQETLQHECTHQLNSAVMANKYSAIWVEEGLATYFQSLRRDKDGRLSIGYIGNNCFGHFSFVPLRDLIQRNKKDFHINEYNQSATLIRFFLIGAGKKYKQRFLEYIKRNYSGSADPLKDFEECFTGITMDELEKEFIKGWSK